MQDFYCNRVFLHSGTSTFTQVQDLSTSTFTQVQDLSTSTFTQVQHLDPLFLPFLESRGSNRVSLVPVPPPTPNILGRTTNVKSTAVKARATCCDVDTTMLGAHTLTHTRTHAHTHKHTHTHTHTLTHAPHSSSDSSEGRALGGRS